MLILGPNGCGKTIIFNGIGEQNIDAVIYLNEINRKYSYHLRSKEQKDTYLNKEVYLI